MVFDLRHALLKKEERDSARLMEFEFRHRARTFQLLAKAVGVDRDETARQIMRMNDSGVLTWLAQATGCDDSALQGAFAQCAVEARRQLIEEVGNPAPHRLA